MILLFSMTFLILLLLLLFAFSPGRGDVVVGKPLVLVDGRVIRVDVTKKINVRQAPEHIKILSARVCAAIDMPFLDHNPAKPLETGCSSPGYKAVDVYSFKTEIKSRFKARLFRPNIPSLYLQRLLVDGRTPIVYVEMHVLVSNSVVALGRGVGKEVVVHTFYKIEGESHDIEEKDVEETRNNPPIDYKILFIPVGVGMILFAGMFLVVSALRNVNVKRRTKSLDYAENHSHDTAEKIRDAMLSATEMGIFQRCYETNDPFLSKRE